MCQKCGQHFVRSKLSGHAKVCSNGLIILGLSSEVDPAMFVATMFFSKFMKHTWYWLSRNLGPRRLHLPAFPFRVSIRMEEKSNDITFNIAYTRINTMRVTYNAATSETLCNNLDSERSLQPPNISVRYLKGRLSMKGERVAIYTAISSSTSHISSPLTRIYRHTRHWA